MRVRAALLIGALVATGAVAACKTTATLTGTCLSSLSATAATSTSASTSTATSASAAATSVAATPVAATPGAESIPDLPLGCLDGTGDVVLTTIRRPMILSMWASYCQPCQAESPQIEAFVKAAAGAVAVVGIDTADDAAKGKSFVSSFGLTYPMLADPTSKLIDAVAPPTLPTLLFVTAAGRIAGVVSTNQLDTAMLRQLTGKYLGVQIP